MTQLFNDLILCRALRKDLYPDGRGLLGSNGEEWWAIRSKVNQVKYLNYFSFSHCCYVFSRKVYDSIEDTHKFMQPNVIDL